jgi:hypothetical protein
VKPLKEKVTEPGVVVHAIIFILRRLRQEDLKFEASLGNQVKLCFKQHKKNIYT